MSSSDSDFEEASPVISNEEEAIEDIKSSKRPYRNKTVSAKLSESAEEQKERSIDDETSKFPYVHYIINYMCWV